MSCTQACKVNEDTVFCLSSKNKLVPIRHLIEQTKNKVVAETNKWILDMVVQANRDRTRPIPVWTIKQIGDVSIMFAIYDAYSNDDETLFMERALFIQFSRKMQFRLTCCAFGDPDDPAITISKLRSMITSFLTTPCSMNIYGIIDMAIDIAKDLADRKYVKYLTDEEVYRLLKMDKLQICF
jgi:hypothetical protein